MALFRHLTAVLETDNIEERTKIWHFAHVREKAKMVKNCIKRWEKKEELREGITMKICYLANAASVHTQRWINYFAEHGWKVNLNTWHPPTSNSGIHPTVNVRCIHFPPHYIARYGALLEITRLIKKIRPDIIHAHYISHFGILAGLYGRLSGFKFKPIVLTAWGSDILVDAKGLKKRLIY